MNWKSGILLLVVIAFVGSCWLLIGRPGSLTFFGSNRCADNGGASSNNTQVGTNGPSRSGRNGQTTPEDKTPNANTGKQSTETTEEPYPRERPQPPLEIPREDEIPKGVFKVPGDRPRPTADELRQYESLRSNVSFVDETFDEWDAPLRAISLEVYVRRLSDKGFVQGALVEAWVDGGEDVWRAKTSDIEGLPNATLLCPYHEDAVYAVRVTHESLTGFSVVSGHRGVGLRARSSNVRRAREDKVKALEVVVEVFITDQPVGMRPIVVKDAGGKALAGASIWYDGLLLGTSGDSGILRFHDHPRILKTDEPKRPLGRYLLHMYGYIPIFLDRDELLDTQADPLEVVLRAKELVVSIHGRLPKPLRLLSHMSGWDLKLLKPESAVEDWASLQPWLKWVTQSERKKLAIKALAGVLGLLEEKTWEQDYGKWYWQNWSYNADTGVWDVVLPYRGKFILEAGYLSANERGQMQEKIYLYIDSTDPANVTGKIFISP